MKDAALPAPGWNFSRGCGVSPWENLLEELETKI